MQHAGRYSTRLHLVGLVAAVAIPIIAFSSFVIYRYAKVEQARIEREAVRIATQTGLLVDTDLKLLLARLEGLASSSALTRDDLEAFHAEAARLTKGRDETILLRDMGQRQLFNSNVAFNTPLPMSPPFTPEQRDSYERGQAHISDVYKSPRDGQPRIVVSLPIIRNGAPVYALGLTVPTSHIVNALLPALAPGYIVAVGDRQGMYVARSERHDDVTGKPGLPDYVRHVIGPFGSFEAANFEGRLLRAGYYRSGLSGWFYTANIPSDIIDAPLKTALLQLAVFGLVALILSGVLALVFSQFLTSPARQLAKQARSIGEGQILQPVHSTLTEFASISDALVAASEAIDARSRERERAEKHRQLLVNELNHRVKNSLTIAQSIALQTLRSARSIAEARTALSARLVSLARSHDVLTSENWEGADVRHVVANTVNAFAASDRIDFDGPSLKLSPGSALTLSLILHELLTNAAKYGAMSAEDGAVVMRWSGATSSEGEPRLHFRFEERGGPPVAPPSHSGFGSRLFAASFSSPAEGTMDIRYPTTGVICEIELRI